MPGSVRNAIKYSKGAEQIIVRMAIHERDVEVSVQDFGIGISPDNQTKIFEQFYQVSEADGATYPGLGIGLYISRNIIERHQGRLCVQSRKGEGSTFSLHLPLAENATGKTEEGAGSQNA